MNKRVLFLALLFPVLVTAAPYAGYFYPSGGAAGSRFQVLVGGQGLWGILGAEVSGTGVAVRKVTLVPGFRNLYGSQKKYTLEWLKRRYAGNPERPPLPEKRDDWFDKAGWFDILDTLDSLSLSIVAKELLVPRNRLQETPSLRQLVILEIEIAPDAPPGRREIRLFTRQGFTPPRPFYVDREKHLQKPFYHPSFLPPLLRQSVEELPVILDGQVMPGETVKVDLKLNKGRTVRLAVTARELQPFIGDAVPGFFQAALRIVDGKGRELLFGERFLFHPDPAVLFTPPEDGTYTLEIRDNLYRGREDFIYRVMIDYGRELPEPDPVQLPFSVSDRQGNSHVFSGIAGEKFVAEVIARRAGSPLDGVLTLSGPDGKVLMEADDQKDLPDVGTTLQHIDPKLELTLPATGKYTLQVRDGGGRSGALYRYRLRYGTPQPDFEVYSLVSGVAIPGKGGRGKLKLRAYRKEGFSGPLQIVAEDLKILKGGTIGTDQTETVLLLLNRKLPGNRFTLNLYAVGTIGGKEVKKPVIPADEYMQAFAYTHLLPAEELRILTPPPWHPLKKKNPQKK